MQAQCQIDVITYLKFSSSLKFFFTQNQIENGKNSYIFKHINLFIKTFLFVILSPQRLK